MSIPVLHVTLGEECLLGPELDSLLPGKWLRSADAPRSFSRAWLGSWVPCLCYGLWFHVSLQADGETGEGPEA